jgi:hypothetical protein
MPLETPLPLLPVQTCHVHVRQTLRGPPPARDVRRWSQPRWVLNPKVRHDRACASEIPGWRLPHARAPPLPPADSVSSTIRRRSSRVRNRRVAFPTAIADALVLKHSLSQGQFLLPCNRECPSAFSLVQTAIR